MTLLSTNNRPRSTRAAILERQNAALVVADVELPELGVGHVLVEVAASGICGKQLDEISGKRGADPYLPHLLGHEAAGRVLDIGPGVRMVKVGDPVVLHWMKGKGIDAAPPTFQWKGQQLNAGQITTWSRFTIVSENRLTVIAEAMPLVEAALLGCAVTTGLGILFRNLQLMPGSSFLVFGVGGVGMNVIQGARLVNAFPIVAVDINDMKLEVALRFGATHAVDGRRSDLKEALLKICGPSGFDASVEVTGITSVRELCYELTSDRGTTVLAGVPPATERLCIDALKLAFGKRLLASHGGETIPEVDIARAVRLYQEGKLQLAEQISHRFPLERINEAIELVKSGAALRCVITMG